jgi:1,4-alpha-glucan branching enzyme
MSAVPREGYRLGLPMSGVWLEVLNTDAHEYGGSGVGNLGAVTALDEPWHGRTASAHVTLPPLATIWLRPSSIPPVTDVKDVVNVD